MKLDNKWKTVLWYLAVVIVAILTLLHESASSIVRIWWRSETFAHGFFVVPVVLWLVWRKRHQLGQVEPEPVLYPIFLIFLVGFVWLAGRMGRVQVVEHLALVTILALTVWSVVGTQAASFILFPLAFLFFAAPVGEELMPVMMQYTAKFTVIAIRLSGVPVFQEGLYFSLPSGNWSVVEACSGIRYLIASLTLGTLYAYLNFENYWRRTVFIFLAILVPVVANWIRAYLIVMLGHSSGMELATGVDHLIYGWLFFGVVMFALFSIGFLMREDDSGESAEQTDVMRPGKSRGTPRAVTASVLLVLIAVAAWPAYATLVESVTRGRTSSQAAVTLPSLPNWESVEPESGPWEPRYRGYDEKIRFNYRHKSGHSVHGWFLLYKTQSQGKELINSGNRLISPQNTDWRIRSRKRKQVKSIGSGDIDFQEAYLMSGTAELLVWRWNRVANINTINKYVGKVAEVKAKLLLKSDVGVGVIVATDGENPEAAEVLQSFVDDIYPIFERQLNQE